jgi:muconolactone delta-isomerase
MRIVIISRPKFAIPREEVPGMVEAFAAWRAKYRSVTEVFEFFAGGGGGFGVVDVEDEAALHQMMLEYPFGPTSDVEIRPLVSGDQGLAMWRASIEAMMAAAGG